MYILGLSSMEHGPAAAIIGETGVIAAIEEGKLREDTHRGGHTAPRYSILPGERGRQVAGRRSNRHRIPARTSMVSRCFFSNAARAVRAHIQRLFSE